MLFQRRGATEATVRDLRTALRRYADCIRDLDRELSKYVQTRQVDEKIYEELNDFMRIWRAEGRRVPPPMCRDCAPRLVR